MYKLYYFFLILQVVTRPLLNEKLLASFIDTSIDGTGGVPKFLGSILILRVVLTIGSILILKQSIKNENEFHQD
jgi:hypothetical protein